MPWFFGVEDFVAFWVFGLGYWKEVYQCEGTSKQAQSSIMRLSGLTRRAARPQTAYPPLAALSTALSPVLSKTRSLRHRRFRSRSPARQSLSHLYLQFLAPRRIYGPRALATCNSSTFTTTFLNSYAYDPATLLFAPLVGRLTPQLASYGSFPFAPLSRRL